MNYPQLRPVFLDPEHVGPNVLIEIVGESIDIANMKSERPVNIEPKDIEDELVRSLMPGPAMVLDPCLAFLSYVSAACKDSLWYDFEDNGALAIERAQALLALYKDYILHSLKARYKAGEQADVLIQVLREKFHIQL